MTQEEKELLLKDLCARLPYGVICKSKSYKNILFNSSHVSLIESEEIKPYLRPMSSMTEEELNECVQQSGIGDIKCPNWHDLPKKKHFEARLNHSINMFLVDSRTIDWLNVHHFDYRGLIPMGLALESLEGMYKS